MDKLWLRGISPKKAPLDLWFKELAPSDELRQWFNHEEEKWPEFQHRYRQELDTRPQALTDLQHALRGRKKVTLLFGAKDELHNQAVVLRDYLMEHAG